jgi:hypothetical protein
MQGSLLAFPHLLVGDPLGDFCDGVFLSISISFSSFVSIIFWRVSMFITSLATFCYIFALHLPL